MINTICNYNCGIKQKMRKRKFNSHFLLFCTKDAVRALYTALRNVLEQKIILIITNDYRVLSMFKMYEMFYGINSLDPQIHVLFLLLSHFFKRRKLIHRNFNILPKIINTERSRDRI